ncbi:conserved exported hypothetical protein [uncultured Eubacteriales bacterium]|uniref:AlgX/AlgJ SGNH hydrolase-like domain-containing protein n=1 Tax=uncultured Eubacteriales bacterium TaxID=172733 RepID=A0A212KDM8_9FIRM|nr:conserved exported hypothetical protein [uncultured Eubacteriales bacterium]
MKRKESITAVLFLCALAAGFVMLASSFFGGEGHLESAVRAVIKNPGSLKSFLVSAEGAANQDLDRTHLFIQLYGGAQRITGRRMVVDMADPDYTVARLNDGSLAFQNLTTAPSDQTAHARAIADLRDYAEEELGAPLLYIQAPQKIETDQLPDGMENYGNQDADQLLDALSDLDVDTLDLRPALQDAARDPETPALYFNTDHHWTPEGAFLGYQALSAELKEKYGYAADPQFLETASYEVTTYDDWFLGSQGKRVGTLYGGVDSINLWKPRFATDFTYSSPAFFDDRTGPFETSLLFPERLEPKDYFGGNPYTLYSGGDYPLARMYNNLNPDGPRILLIRDSFSCALAPFLALQCGELMTMDMRYFTDDLASYLDWLNPDLVLVMYSASATRLDEMYPFTDYFKQ